MTKQDDYIKKYEKIHLGQERLHVKQKDGTFTLSSTKYPYGDGGQVIKKLLPFIDSVIKYKKRAINILDYGCGQALHVSNHTYRRWSESNNFANQTIFSYFKGMIQSYYCYDPCVPKFSLKPTQGSKFDIVLSADVLEHIPEENIVDTLNDMNSFLKDDGVCVLAISGILASSYFFNEQGGMGENVHITVKPIEWWKQKIMSTIKDRSFVLNFTSNSFIDEKTQTYRSVIAKHKMEKYDER